MNGKAHAEARVGFRSTFRALRDDRGKPIRRLNQNDLQRAARSENPGLAAVAQRLKAAAKSERRRTTPDRVVLSAALSLSFFLCFEIVARLLSVLLVGGYQGLVTLTVFVGMVYVAYRTYLVYVLRGALGQLARTAVAGGVCGSCAFSLEGAVSDADGRVVCPECGAAWRAERIVAPFWTNPTVPVLRRRILASVTPGSRPPRELYTPDDRGRYVQTPDARLMRVRPELLADVSDSERRLLRCAMRRVGRGWRVAATIPLLLVPALAGWLAWILYWIENEPIAAAIIAGFALVVLIPTLLVPVGSPFCAPRHTARVIVRHGRCGSCLAPLGHAGRDAEGRSVCDRCGSAWLSPDASPTVP